MSILPSFVLPGLAFILTVTFGLWLSRSGKPYNGLLFNVHKLVALAAVILTVVQFVRLLTSVGLPAISSALLVPAGLCAFALFISGALMSAGKFDHTLLRTIHRIALTALVVALPYAVFLIARRL
ncbi:MAG: hypothetical protein ACPLRU_05675 [Desulfofundulus sp.]